MNLRLNNSKHLISFIFLLLLAIPYYSAQASIISHSKKTLADSSYVLNLNMNTQQYVGQYRSIMQLIQNGEMNKAKQVLAMMLTQNPNDIYALDISGNILLAENKIPNAIDAFQRVLKKQASADVMSKLGASYLLNGDIKNAKLWLTQALSLNPNNALALRYLAWLEGQALNKGMQLHYLSQLVELNSEKNALFEYHITFLALLSETNKINRGLDFIAQAKPKLKHSQSFVVDNVMLIETELLLKSGQLKKAKESFRQLPIASTDDAYATNYKIISVLYNASIKDFQAAKSIIEDSLSDNPEAKSLAQHTLARAYFDQSNYSAAHDLLVSNLESTDQLARKMGFIDDILANFAAQSRYGDAIKFLKAQINDAPDIPQYQHQLAELYIISGRNKAANKQLDKVIAEFPLYAPSYIVKGRRLIKKGTPEDITAFYHSATKKHPKVAELWTDLASYYVKQDELENAQKTLESGIEHNNANLQLAFELATLYDQRMLFSSSEPLYVKILQNYPEYLPALDNLASNYFLTDKKLDIAIVLAKRAYLLSPDDIYIKNLRAQAYIAENKSSDAIKLISPIILEFNDSGVGSYTLAQAYFAADKHELAVESLNLALSKHLPPAVRTKAVKLKGIHP